MDLSQFSTEDLQALQSGDISKVSTDGLLRMKGQTAAQQPKVTLGPKGFEESVRQELALSAGPLDRLAMGVSGAVDNAAMRLKQLTAQSPGPVGAIARMLGVSAELSPAEQQAVIANRVNAENLEGMAGNVLGGIAMTGAPAAGMMRGITGALAPQGAGLVARTAAPTLAGAATGGTMVHATNPSLPGESENRNVAYGAAGGAIGDVAGRVLGRALQPVRPTPGAERLIQQDITPTIGQSAGANSILGRIEQGLQSIPGIGDIIRTGRGRATEDLNIAALRRTLPANARGDITRAGRESIDRAGDILSSGYDTVVNNIGRIRVDRQFTDSVANIARDPDLSLPRPQAERFIELIRNQFAGRIQNGDVPAEMAKRIDSQLGKLSRDYLRSQDRDVNALGQAILQVRTSWRDAFARSASNPDDVRTLQELNGYWANLVRVERAAGYQGAAGGKHDPGVFTAPQLSSAVRAEDTSVRKRAFARGDALMQDLSDTARQVLGDTVPDSGTTGRALLAAGVLGGAGATNEGLDIAPSWVTGMLLSPLLYSRTGAQLATGQLTPNMIRALQQVQPSLPALGSILAREQQR